jgi:hypothetical protein
MTGAQPIPFELRTNPELLTGVIRFERRILKGKTILETGCSDCSVRPNLHHLQITSEATSA